RDYKVTGVQTCALPISPPGRPGGWGARLPRPAGAGAVRPGGPPSGRQPVFRGPEHGTVRERMEPGRARVPRLGVAARDDPSIRRSEERRVGKERKTGVP